MTDISRRGFILGSAALPMVASQPWERAKEPGLTLVPGQGREVMRIDASGIVGVGSTAPATPLKVIPAKGAS